MNPQVIKYVLWVQDMDRAFAFYRDVIGLTARLESEHWSELTFGDAVIALHGGGRGGFRETGLSVQVGDLDAACLEVERAGGQIRRGPAGRPGEPVRLADLTDPEGNGFMLTQYVGR